MLFLQDAINIAPFRRQIRVVDKNDNAPEFVRNVYKFDVDETEPVGKTLFSEIAISDQDEGANSVVKLGTIQILRNHFYVGGGGPGSVQKCLKRSKKVQKGPKRSKKVQKIPKGPTKVQSKCAYVIFEWFLSM